MFDMSLQQMVILIVVAMLVLGSRHFRRMTRRDDTSPLQAELRRRMPVFSAETTGGKEAEFIRDRLPKRFPYALVLVAALVLGGIAWWASR